MTSAELWLDGLGLGKYARVFAEQAIDADVIPDLEDADLEKLGIPLGDRKRMLKAIAGLADDQRRTEPVPTPPGFLSSSLRVSTVETLTARVRVSSAWNFLSRGVFGSKSDDVIGAR